MSDAVSVPGAQNGAGFDDLNFSFGLKKVIVPAGATGQTLLIDPVTQAVTVIGAALPDHLYKGGHGEGVTSADEANGVLFTVDRTSKTVNAWDVSTNSLVSSAPLASSPDYVRYVDLTREVWVTEPDKARIEIFDFTQQSLKHTGFIDVPGGPEALVIDRKRQMAYTHLWERETVKIDIKKRSDVAHWSNSCASSHGIALDETRGFLFVGCTEGKIAALDVDHNGQMLGALTTGGSGVDVIGYNAGMSHAYLAASQAGKLSIVEISEKGVPELSGIISIPRGAHCVTGDSSDGIWVCDPYGGKIAYFKDNF